LTVNLLVWLAIFLAIRFGYRWRKKRRGSLFRFNSLDLLVAVTLVALVFGGINYWERNQKKELATIKSLDPFPKMFFKFNTTTPVWLDRLSDFRLHPYVHQQLHDTTVKQANFKRLGLFDRATSVLISATNDRRFARNESQSKGQPVFEHPAKVAKSLNQLSSLEQIQIYYPSDESVVSLLREIDGAGIKFLLLTKFNFEEDGSAITHFRDLETLNLQMDSDLTSGIIKSFPKLKSLNLAGQGIDDGALDEVLNLKQLSFLTLTKSKLTKAQIELLDGPGKVHLNGEGKKITIYCLEDVQ
jgi:hypothetical protein